MRSGRVAFLFLSAILGAFAFSSAQGQQPAPKDSVPAPIRPNDSVPPLIRLRIFLDCNVCDFDFMRTEIAFVDYVRDRQDAQVHILVTDQSTGGGGTEYTLHFIGQRELANIADTIAYVSPPSASPDDRRSRFSTRRASTSSGTRTSPSSTRSAKCAAIRH
jgi:hypothetical protein